MKRRILIEYSVFIAVSALFLSVAFAAGYFIRGAGIVERSDAGTPVLDQVRVLLSAHYLGELPIEKDLEYAMIRGLVAAIEDPFTAFVEPAAHEIESEQLAGVFGGVGVTLSRNEHMDLVLDVTPRGPAEAAGVREGDRLLNVDELPVGAEMALEEVAALIRGPVGSEVRLTLRHRGEAETFTLTMQRISTEIPSVEWRLADEDLTVGVISISRFSVKTPEEVRAALSDLLARGATKIVLDLRNNGGGLLESGVEVAGLFVDGGLVMYEQRQGEPEQTVEAKGEPAGALVPLAVLVNDGTASAAEVVAGALNQRGRAPLIGQRTFGKGSVQSIFDLQDGSSLHVTSARWYTPDRTPLDGRGLPPTVAVEPAADGRDAELRAALEFLSSE